MGISCIAKMVVSKEKECECIDLNTGPASCKSNKHYCCCLHYEPFKCRSGKHSCSCIRRGEHLIKKINGTQQCRSVNHQCSCEINKDNLSLCKKIIHHLSRV
jgi:hypothetical protein